MKTCTVPALLQTLVLFFLLSVVPPVLADYPIEIIQLEARPLDEVLPMVRSLLGDNGTATGMGSSLVVKAAPDRVREIRKLLREIDRPPRRLLITVSTTDDSDIGSSGYAAGADIRSGDGRVRINALAHSAQGSRACLRLHDADSRRTRTADQTLQVLEGRPAFIASGATIPYQDVERHAGNGQLYERRVTRMYDASSGFQVVPRVSGDFVTLEIHQRNDRPGRRGGVINTQSADTVVRGRLGEWISLGSIDTVNDSNRGGLARSGDMRGSALETIRVKVESLDDDAQSSSATRRTHD